MGSSCSTVGKFSTQPSRLVPSFSAQTAPRSPQQATLKSPPISPQNWNKESAAKLQQAVDQIFGTREGSSSLHNLEFSFSIADPLLEGCPLIGCSTGFTKLCGYDLKDIVGRNCRFLVDPVPAEQVDKNMRRHSKDFCEAVRDSRGYSVPTNEREQWMPAGRPTDELFAMQRNVRKDGTFFNNLFYMKVFHLGTEVGTTRPYIVALQSELVGGKDDLAVLAVNVEQLDGNMLKLKKKLAALFFMQISMTRQLHSSFAHATDDYRSEASGSSELTVSSQAPKHLHSAFDLAEIKPWVDSRFTMVRKLADAPRNAGKVDLMQDQKKDQLFAVKQMPNTWIKESHEEFLRERPDETELPWQDIGCTRYLNSVAFKYACDLHGVYRTKNHTYVVSAFEPDGDLFCTSERGSPPGPQREEEIKPLILELFRAVQQLHDMQIAHRDISLENVLQTHEESGAVTVKIIDFGMASTKRTFRNCVRGKASYQAPEMHTQSKYDAFSSDTFAVGVIVFMILMKDYPWMSTKLGCCKCFEYIKKNNLRSFCEVRKVRGSETKMSKCISEPLMQLLEGMLKFNPDERLTMGEKCSPNRRSVWDEPWTSLDFQEEQPKSPVSPIWPVGGKVKVKPNPNEAQQGQIDLDEFEGWGSEGSPNLPKPPRKPVMTRLW